MESGEIEEKEFKSCISNSDTEWEYTGSGSELGASSLRELRNQRGPGTLELGRTEISGGGLCMEIGAL